MGSSVGIGALIMGVTLLSVFAVATTVISNQAAVALEVTDPDVIDKPELSLSNLANPGTVTNVVFTQGTDYFPGALVFSDVCDVVPTGSFTVTTEDFRFRTFDEVADGLDPIGNYNDTGWIGVHPTEGDYFQFNDLIAEAPGSEERWTVWYSVNPSLNPDPGFGVSTDEAPTPAGSDPSRMIEVNIDEGDNAEQVRDKTINALQSTPAIQITWTTFATDQVNGVYDNSGPVSSWVGGNSPLVLEATTPGGVIDTASLGLPNNGGSGCSTQPDVDACASCGGAGDEDFLAVMEWDYRFDITNDGGTPVKLSEIFSTINGGTTEVLSSVPAFTVEYLFPGETINVVKDENTPDSLERVAISSHGMNVAVET